MTTPKLGEVLIGHGVIDEEKLIAALSDQRAFGGKLGRTLVDLGYVSEEQLMRALAEQLGLERVELESADVHEDALRALPVDACERYGVFPVRLDPADNVLYVATAEPDRSTLQEVARIAQRTVEPVLCPMSSIDRAVRHHYGGIRTGPQPAPARDDGPPPRHVEDALVAVVDVPMDDDVESVPPGAARSDVDELRALIIRLEKTVNAQSRAFRALIDLLQEKGVLRRGELGARTTRKT